MTSCRRAGAKAVRGQIKISLRRRSWLQIHRGNWVWRRYQRSTWEPNAGSILAEPRAQIPGKFQGLFGRPFGIATEASASAAAQKETSTLIISNPWLWVVGPMRVISDSFAFTAIRDRQLKRLVCAQELIIWIETLRKKFHSLLARSAPP